MQKEENKTELKVLLYNILNGGCGDNQPYVPDWKRLENISKVLDREKADLVVLCEAGFWPGAVQKKFNKWSSFFSSLYSSPIPADQQFRWGPVVVSKYPIVSQSTARHAFHFTTLDVVLDVNGKHKSLTVYHPYPDVSEGEKAAHLSKLLVQQAPDILVGDLNALSPEDSYNEKSLTTAFSKFMHDKANAKIKDSLTCKTLKVALDAGFQDSFTAAQKPWTYTMPTDLRSTDKTSGIRIDYILSRGMKVRDAGVIKNKLTEYSSDHYPIYAILS